MIALLESFGRIVKFFIWSQMPSPETMRGKYLQLSKVLKIKIIINIGQYMLFFKSLRIIIPFNENLAKWQFAKERSSYRKCSVRKDVLINFAKFTGKHLCQGLIFNKVASLRPATLLKKRLWHRCFPVNFAKFLRAPFLQNTSGRLLLQKSLVKFK